MARRVAIVGGGAAGIYAALAARQAGADVTLYERNARIGIKILISGGGKCNITHDAAPRELEHGFIQAEARFLRYAFHEFPSGRVLDDLHREGVATITRPNGRVFPASGRAEDVLAAFERMLDRAGVTLRTGSLVERIEPEREGIRVVGAGGGLFDAVVVTTGGMSYRKVGTTGDGVRWGAETGHDIVAVRAALAPMYFPAKPPAEWQGVALRDVLFRTEIAGAAEQPRRDRPPAEWRDDLLLTHRGVSGPAALEISRAAALLRERAQGDVRLLVDVVPDIPLDELRKRWVARLAESGRWEVQTFVEGFVPRAVVPAVLAAAGLIAGARAAEVTRDERDALLATLKRWPVGIVAEVPVDRGEVTAGGISLSDVSPKTMESLRVPGLYFAGEVLDIAGAIGGYNLQAAFATGYVAGKNAGKN